MPYFSRLSDTSMSRDMVSTFGGYNHNLKISDGEWYEDENMSARYFPVLATRGKRGKYADVTALHGIIAKDALGYVDGDTLYYNGNAVAGLTLSTLDGMVPKQLISMGALIVIFPDKKWYNTQDGTYGSLEASYESSGTVTMEMCRYDGADFGDYTVSASEPVEPENGDFWLDTSGQTHVLKQYSETSAMWMQVATTYVRISCTGIGAPFSVGDGVTVAGLTATGGAKEPVERLNATSKIIGKGDDYIVLIGIIDQQHTQTETVTVKRSVPQMDYVIEHNNRLWGCFYGVRDGKSLNEIYASALGDPKNWNVFTGIASDSYTVSLGTDGVFTGAVSYLGRPMFFKEQCVHIVTGSVPSNFGLETVNMAGVQDGSYRSIANVSGVLYYKAPAGIFRYTGDMPDKISDAFGDEQYRNAVSGGIGTMYYTSMQDDSGKWHMFTYDAKRGIWHHEDNTHATFFANVDTDLYFGDADASEIRTVYGTGEAEDDFDWSVTSGIIGFETPDFKYVGRINLRLQMAAESFARFFIEYDSDGQWIPAGCLDAERLRTITLPICPHRCDHFRLRICGTGEFKLYSITKIIENGSDY